MKEYRVVSCIILSIIFLSYLFFPNSSSPADVQKVTVKEEKVVTKTVIKIVPTTVVSTTSVLITKTVTVTVTLPPQSSKSSEKLLENNLASNANVEEELSPILLMDNYETVNYKVTLPDAPSIPRFEEKKYFDPVVTSIGTDEDTKLFRSKNYDSYLKYVKNVNKLYEGNKNLTHTLKKEFKSTYQCVGKNNVYNHPERRNCVFNDICYDTREQNFVYYQPMELPVFSDKSYGPIFNFNENETQFVKLNALPFESYYFTPVVKIGKPEKKDSVILKNQHVLFSTWAPEMNIGHFIYEELLSTLIAMKKLNMFDVESQLLNYQGDFNYNEDDEIDFTSEYYRDGKNFKGKSKIYKRLSETFTHGITNKKIIGLKKYLKEISQEEGKPLVCFKNLVVASAGRQFWSYEDNHNENLSPIFFEYRNNILSEKFGLNPYHKPKKHLITIVHKTGSFFFSGKHAHDIYNIEEVTDHVTSKFPDIEVNLVEISKLSFEEQFKLLLNTTVIITPCGSGLDR
ncbi:hypothetical protein HK099_004122 [Clydaea vesicula]|uniref:Glycosyltransferase 61 catalytic domain-containing protein n=1 Tax=Clydaea vesicula TaxID=447962 RepID=A0AAD5U0M7_9FUNG|nr:hypothetical protein HK099_004122 [Clydaea vesicula]